MDTAPIDPAPPAAVERTPRFIPPDILWYFGALVAAAAGDALIGGTSPAHRGVWMLLVGLASMAGFGALAAALLRLGHHVPGGVLAAAVVWLAPPTEVALEHLFNVHPRFGSSSYTVNVGVTSVPVSAAGGGFHGALFAIALGTAAVGLGVYWLVRFAFVLLPVVLSLAFAAVLFLPAVVSHPDAGDYVATVLITGIVFFVAGLLLDARLHRRDAFWWYVVGLFGVAVAFAYYLARHHTWVWLVLLVVAAGVLLASAPLSRAVWAVYAVIGIYAALGHYTDVVTGSWRTTLVLVLVGLLLVGVGTVLDAAGSAVVARLTRPAPPWLRRQPPP